MSETVMVSLCLLGVPCRYHGKLYKMGHKIGRPALVKKIMSECQILPLCGEQLGGLPTPRPPCKVVGDKVTTKDGKCDYTEEYHKGANIVLELCLEHGVKRTYLLKNSPMCGADGILGKLLTENGIKVSTV